MVHILRVWLKILFIEFLTKKINPYTFDMRQKEVSEDKSIILTKAYRIWLRGYKLMSELKGTNVRGETYLFDYWHEQIMRHRNEAE